MHKYRSQIVDEISIAEKNVMFKNIFATVGGICKLN